MHTQLFLSLLLLLCGAAAQAKRFCVHDGESLQQALDEASGNDQHDEIRLHIGVYTQFRKAGFKLNVVDGMDVEISGGWLDADGLPCLDYVHNPHLTVFDGDNQRRNLQVALYNGHRFSFSNAHITRGNTYWLNHDSGGAGVHIQVDDNRGGRIHLEHLIFNGNQGDLGPALTVEGGGELLLRNNVFFGNTLHVWSVVSGVVAVLNDAAGVYVVNNTLINNAADSRYDHAGLTVNIKEGAQAVVANNLFWHNDGGDLSLMRSPDSSGTAFLLNNNVGAVTGHFTQNQDNLHVDPQVIPLDPWFALQAHSPLRNRGLMPLQSLPGFEHQWGPGELDLSGEDRVLHGRVDIGAMEISD